MDATNPKDLNKKQKIKDKLRERKKEAKKNKRRARIVVRNVPFTATEQNLKEHFEKFGEIDEIKLLKKPDGQPVGCAFVQFKLVQKAAKAIHHTNGKPFLDRNITCEWALSKTKYKEVKLKEIKQEPIDPDTVKVKQEPADELDNTETNFDPSSDIKIEKESACDSETEKSSADENEPENIKTTTKPEEIFSDENREDDSSEEELSDDEDAKKIETNQEIPRPKVVSNDVTEGKTIFIKNVPFSATDEDVYNCMKEFGPLYYARVCMDKFTEHSKGSAFVKYRNKEDADECLKATNVTLLDNVLEFHQALSRDDVSKRGQEKFENKRKDSRNLYLVKEGVILAGTKAAEGVSAADMAKRLQLETYKTQMLRNLNMFVSKLRLFVQNIPLHWDEQKLKSLFAKHVSPNAVMKQAIIMRNMRDLDNKGVGKSKGIGFVAFQDHEDALKALRALNNNPEVFSKNSRPVISFSIENRSKIKAQEKRALQSQLKNPNNKQYDPNYTQTKRNGNNQFERGTKRKFENTEVHEENTKFSGKNPKNNERKTNGQFKKEKKRKFENTEVDEEKKKFSGVVATPGIKKFQNKFSLKNQAAIHNEHLKNLKRSRKVAKKTLDQKRKDFTKQEKQKIKKKKPVSDNFSKLVSEYKKKLTSASSSYKKNKWYQEET